MKRISPATGIASAALFLSISGTGVAAGHYLISSTSQIKPSVLRHLRGAQGERGAQGDQGPQGMTGPQGPAGASATAKAYATSVTGEISVHILSNVQQIAPGQTLTLTQTCGQHSVTGGGFIAPGLTVEASRATANLTDTGAPGTYGWLIVVTNPGTTTLTAGVSAVCN